MKCALLVPEDKPRFSHLVHDVALVFPLPEAPQENLEWAMLRIEGGFQGGEYRWMAP